MCSHQLLPTRIILYRGGEKQMALFCCENRCSCTIAGFIASIIIGIIAAVLRFTAVISVTPAFLWVVFGIAIVYLGLTLVGLPHTRTECSSRKCICAALSALIAGILGTVLLSVVLLTIEFAATSVLGAILVGALLFSFSLTVTSTACLVKGYAGCKE